MPVRATVQPLPAPGHAILRISELDASPDGLSLSIERQQGPDSHLADDGWRRTEAWLMPACVRGAKDALEFDLGPEICDRLAGIATVRLRIREPDIGVVGSTVVAWPTMLTSGAVHVSRPDNDDSVQLRRVINPPSEAEAPKAEEPPQPPPRLIAERRPVLEPEGEGGRSAFWTITGLVALVLAAGGAYAYWHFAQNEGATSVAAVAPGQAPKKSIRETVAEYFATKPTPEAMLATGHTYAQSGDMEGAFLVWRRAAEAGNAVAQLELAAFYDPLIQPPRAGFSPDGTRAAEWYERAALAGLPEAQRKYGLLLAKGGAGLTADRGKARDWLKQAAAQNDAEAKQALDALPR